MLTVNTTECLKFMFSSKDDKKKLRDKLRSCTEDAMDNMTKMIKISWDFIFLS